MRDDEEMRDEDGAEFGAIVDSLVGARCEGTLATNTIKLRFNTEEDPVAAGTFGSTPRGLYLRVTE
jgi:hypothetical protein